MQRRSMRSLALVAALAAASPAGAQTLEELWQRCDDPKADVRIAGCTSVIRSGYESGANLSVAFAKRGLAFAWKSEHERAIQDYDQAIRLNPANASALTNRGIAYTQTGQHDRAIADFDQAIRLQPSNPQHFNNRGFAYARKGQDERAIQDYDQAIRLNPSAAFTLNNRASAFYRLSRYEHAIVDCDRVLHLEPMNPAALYRRGLARQRKGDAVGGAADIAAARAIKAGIADEVTRIDRR
jgi:tetratricopeptide (TPR) repeat protein